MSDELLIKQNGRILEARFNREDGACSDAMAAELSAAMLSAHETSDMVLLRSAGPDFCTGRARNADAGKPDPEAYSRRAEYDSIFNCYKAIRNAQVPIVGVIEGRCMGFGTAVAALVRRVLRQQHGNIQYPGDRPQRHANYGDVGAL